ncbi:MAG: hypothetical protein U0105_11365 [Candidatus Obscuribacterales bacterium]
MRFGALALLPALCLVAVTALAALADSSAELKPKTMTRLTLKIVNPASSVRKDVWRCGDGMLRMEQRTAGQTKIGWISIINSPDTWEIDPVKKTGSHITDEKPPTIVSMPVFAGDDDLAQLEIGKELEFFESHQARVTGGAMTGDGMIDRYQLRIGGKELTLDCRAGQTRPLRITCPQCTGVKEVEYTQYDQVPLQSALFKPEEGITFSPTTYARGALAKPIGTRNPEVTVTVTLAPIVLGTTSMQAWFYQSHGLSTLNQPEVLVVVLKRTKEADDAYPIDPVGLINSLGIAKTSPETILHPGMYADVPGFMSSTFPAVIFIKAPTVEGVAIPSGTLVAVPITDQEHKVCQVAGSSRVMSQLAFENNYLPCPFWCKRNRKTVYTDAQVDQMRRDPFTSGSPSFVSDASALMRTKICTLSITPELGTKLALALKQTKAKHACLRMQLQRDPRAARIPLWHPDKKAAREYLVRSGTDDSVSPQFLLIASDQPEDRLDIVQDGFALFLTNASYEKLIKSLTGEPEPIPLAAGDAVQFSTMWNMSAPDKQPSANK